MTDTQRVEELADVGLPGVLLPQVVHEATAAFLVVDLNRREVTYANELARQLTPGLALPASVDEWSAAAGLEDIGGDDLPQERPTRTASRSESLLRVAQGEPVLGEGTTARLGTAVTQPREPLWVIGIPLIDAPPPFESLALVAFLPLRSAKVVTGAQESAALLRDRAVLATKVSFTITDPTRPDNALVWVNPAFSAMTGYTFDDAVGQNCRFLQGVGTDRRIAADIARALRAGRPITTTLLNYRKDGAPFWNELSISPILDPGGNVSHFVGVQADVTARVQAQRARDEALIRAEVSAGRLALLADYATRLTSSLENDEIVALLADVLVPRLGTWCALHLIDEAEPHTRSIVRHERADDPQIAQLVSVLDESLRVDGLPPESPTARVLRGELPYVFVPDVFSDPTAAGRREDDRNAVAAELGVSGLMIVPLRSRTRVLGCAAIMADGAHRPFAEADLTLAQELAGRTALMLENAMLYLRERTAAVTLQRSLMPLVPQIPGLTMAARYLTAADEAAVGGDWYDVFALQNGGFGLAVGDAMGHDVGAAAAMGKLSTILRSYAWPGAAAGEVLDATDALLTGTRLGYLATCCYGVLELVEGGATFEYANAGHPPPIVRRPDGAVDVLTGGHSAMLGVRPLVVGGSTPRQGDMVKVPHGSTLVFFTDGLTDSLGEDTESSTAIERLAQIVSDQPTDVTPRQLVGALAQHAQGGRTDDVVIVAVRID